jgi:hypothetical protein
MKYIKDKKKFEAVITDFDIRYTTKLNEKELNYIKSRTGLDITNFNLRKEDFEYFLIDSKKMFFKFETLGDLSDWLTLIYGPVDKFIQVLKDTKLDLSSTLGEESDLYYVVVSLLTHCKENYRHVLSGCLLDLLKKYPNKLEAPNNRIYETILLLSVATKNFELCKLVLESYKPRYEYSLDRFKQLWRTVINNIVIHGYYYDIYNLLFDTYKDFNVVINVISEPEFDKLNELRIKILGSIADKADFSNTPLSDISKILEVYSQTEDLKKKLFSNKTFLNNLFKLSVYGNIQNNTLLILLGRLNAYGEMAKEVALKILLASFESLTTSELISLIGDDFEDLSQWL